MRDKKESFLFSAMALLYMFRVTISPIIRSTYAVSCWTYFTTIKHDSWNHKYQRQISRAAADYGKHKTS